MHLDFHEVEITSFSNTLLEPLNTGLPLSYFITSRLSDVKWEYNCEYGGRKDVEEVFMAPLDLKYTCPQISQCFRYPTHYVFFNVWHNFVQTLGNI